MSPLDQQTLTGTVRTSEDSVWIWPLAALALTWGLVIALFWDTAAAMVTIWYRSQTFNHCFVVLPISVWLVWRQRYGLSRMAPRPSPMFLLPVAAMVLMWLLGNLVAVNSVTQLAFVAVLVLAVPTILGTRVAYAMAFPLAFLFFSVPIGEFLMPQLMESTADFTVAALRMSGIPVLREGLQFVIPSGNWSVVEACSGVRYLIASLMVGTLFAYLNYRSTKRRLLFGLVSLLVPIIANWLRAYMIVMLGHLSGNTLAVGVDHLIYGWIFFGIVILLMFIIGARWSEPEHLLPADNGAFAAETRAPGLSGRTTALVALVFLVVAALPEAAHWVLVRHQAADTLAFAAPPVLSATWRQTEPSSMGYRPAFQNPSAEINQAYQSGSEVVGLYVGYYRNQNYDRKLVSSENVLVTSSDKDWAWVRGGVRKARLDGSGMAVREIEMRRLRSRASDGGDRLFAWQVYWIDGTLTANDYLAKIYSAAKRLMGQGDESAVIVVYTEKRTAVDANALLAAFMAANYESIDGMLKQVRGRESVAAR